MTPPAGELISHAKHAVSLVKQAGGINPSFSRGSDGMLIWWTDPQTRSTLALSLNQIRTVEDVRRHMEASRAKFTKGRVYP